MHPQEIQARRQQVRISRSVLARLAREDINVFCEFVMKDELTGKALRQAPIHEVWHKLADEHEFLLIWSHVEAGKTFQMAVARTLWELGRCPNLRFCILSNTNHQAKKISRVIRSYIEHSPELKLVFPNLKPSTPWGEYGFNVQRTVAGSSKDFSVATCGETGNIQGSRYDRIVVDDILDYENCRTPTRRDKTYDWFMAIPYGRLTEDARVLCIGNAHHPDDMLHRFARNPAWKAVRYPVKDPETGEPRWPERWSNERIDLWVSRAANPIEAQRQLFCETRDDSSSRFKREYIDECLKLGNGKDMISAIDKMPPGWSTYTGVDLAVQRNQKSDNTCFFTIACDPFGNRHVLSIESGKWSGPEIVLKIQDHHRRYMSIVWVENNAAQDFIIQFTNIHSHVPIRPFTTGRNKAHPEFGLESLATELYNRKWIIPNRDGVMHPEVKAWITEMLYYSPEAHTGDRLMASWFAREGARDGVRAVKSFNLDLSRR